VSDRTVATSEVVDSSDRFTRAQPGIIGTSPVWCDALKLATQVARTDTTVCLQGETGTGKELVARLIYRQSARRRGPFVAVNCAALPEHLIESELFGFERGAFTGASLPKAGLFEVARGGVLFLDEIGELPLSAQAKVLRALQEREYFRLGGTQPIKVDIRLIGASKCDLAAAVAAGRLRDDLYYRISVFDILLPPLRARGDDILLLAEEIVKEFARAHAMPRSELTSSAREALLAYAWPGNVRELRNVIERAVIVSEGQPIAAAHLSLKKPRSLAAAPVDLRGLELAAIEQALRDVVGNKARAARRLGISRAQLYVRLRKYGLHA